MKRFLLISAISACTLGSMAQVAEFPDGEYYIRNVETGRYLNCGYSWGTLAVLKEQARTFHFETSDGGIAISSSLGYFKPSDGEMYLDNGSATTNVIEKAGEHYTIKNQQGKYLCSGDVQEWNASYDKGQINVICVDQPDGNLTSWDIISRADMIADLASASPENPMEATFFFKATNFDINDKDNDSAWSYTKNGAAEKLVFPDSGWGHQFGEWHNKATYAWCQNDEPAENVTDIVEQTAEGMPAGKYTATYRVVNQNNTPLVIKFNDFKADPYEFEESDLWYGTAADNMLDHPMTAEFEVGEDGKLTIRMEKSCATGEQNRFAFKSFALKYIGKSSAVDTIEIAGEDADAPVEYYNLQGIKVTNPEKGIFVVRQGNKVSKRVIK